MPNWVYCTAKIEGSYESVKAIHDAGFDFQKIHPCPFLDAEHKSIDDSEKWYEWCCSHWGTKWSPQGIEIVDYQLDMEGCPTSKMTVLFETAWSPPHGFLGFLSALYPDIQIRCEYTEEFDETIGLGLYRAGVIRNANIHPHEFKPSALERFSKSIDWFHYETYAKNLDAMGADFQALEDTKDTKNEVVPNTWSLSYEEFVHESERESAELKEKLKHLTQSAS